MFALAVIAGISIMASRLMRLFRDIWNLGGCHIPSRRVRNFLLKRLLHQIDSSSFVGLGVTFYDPWNITIAERSVVNPKCTIDARGGDVVIEADADIGAETHIWTLEHDPNDRDHGTRGGGIVIKDHAWIATRVTILPGVTIGRGAVVACGAVVTKDVPEKSVVAGVPAKLIAQRENPLLYQLNYRPRFR